LKSESFFKFIYAQVVLFLMAKQYFLLQLWTENTSTKMNLHS